MNPELLIAHFNRIGDAPDAVKHVRQFVYRLAIRGKLTDRELGDESASELLDRIHAGKMQRMKNGRADRLPLIQFDAQEAPITVPKHWVWLPLRSIGTLSGGMTPSKNRPDFWDGEINWFSPKDMKSDELFASEMKITATGVRETGLQIYPPGCLFIVARSGILKRILPVSINRVEAAVNQDLKVLNPFVSGMERYLQIMFIGMTDFILTALVKTGTTVQSLKYEEFEMQAFPLPPLAEQQRIVAKIDELMALCDQLETAQIERDTRRDRLTAASHHHLNSGADTDTFRNYGHFFIGHLPRLTAHPDQIRQFRQTILNVAMRGRLVPQDPHDEPASDLLRRIQLEKTKLNKEGALKKDKALWEGLPKDPPYDIPAAWVWTRLQEVFEISRGGSPRPAGDPRYFGGPVPWITVREITKDKEKYLTSTEGGLTEEGATHSRFIESDDLLLTNSGATLGVPKISRIKACMNDGVAVLRRFHSFQLNDFAYLYLHSQTQLFRKVNQGMGQPNLNTPIIAGWFFPLPPLAEQQRIVAKVEELMALCDQLETQLIATQIEASHLLESVLFNALNADLTPSVEYQLHA